MFLILLYLFTAALLVWSFQKDKKKTKMALKKAWMALDNILPQFMTIILLIGVSLALLTPDDISLLIGGQSGWLGMALSGLVGSITLIPGFVAFPLTAALYQNGAGVMQIAVFICTLMAVGVVTLPAEVKFFGVRASLIRNGLSLVFAFVAAALMGAILS